jgi:trimeric autotransporter adhesin
MSKNLTRKGLAFGALVALASSVVAGAPAHAAGEVVFEPTTGTTYNTFTTLDFALSASLAPGQVAGNITQLKYEIAGGTTGAFEYTVGAAAAAATTATTSATQVVSAGAVVGTANVLNIGLSAATQLAATATKSVTITAFIDSDNDSTVDAGEFQQARTVTFKKPSEVTATTTFTKPTLGGNTFTATVALSGDINARQAAAAVSVEFFKGGVSIADTDDSANSTGTVLTPAQRTNPVVSAWDTTDSVLKAVLYAEADVATPDANYTAYSTTAGTFSAQAIVAGAASGSAAIQAAAAATIDNISVAATASADAKSTTKGVRDVSATTTTAGAATVRTGKSATVVATFLQADDTVVANEPVVVTATGAGIAADTVTVNGNAVVDAAKTFTVNTDASGKISLSIVGADVEATDNVTLAFALQGVTSSNYVVAWNDATYEVYNLGNVLDAASTVVAGGSLAVEYIVADQWGQGISGDYRLNVTRSGAVGRTTAASWNYTPVLTGGKASFTIVDNGAGASTTGDTVAIAVEKALVGGGYTAQAIGANIFDEFVINYAAAAPAASAVTVSATDTTPAITTTAVAAANLYYQAATAPGHADVSHLYGAVTAADGSAVPGAVVTISSAGLGFQPVVADGSGTAAEGNKVFTTGSVTVIADESGRYEVLVYSNLSGKKTVSVTSGSATKTIDLTFDAADDNAGTSLVVDAPSSILPGRTLVVTGTVTDKFGNAVNTTGTNTSGDGGADLSVAYDGPGLIVGSLPTETDADGKFTFRVLLGASETGSATVTTKYDANGDADYADTGDLSVSKSITIGAAPVVATAAASGSTGKFFASATNAEGKKVVIKVSGKFVTSFTGTAAKKSVAIAALKGNRTVTIYVGGTLVLTKLVTIK